MRIHHDFQLKSLNTFGVEAKAKHLSKINTTDELFELFSRDEWHGPKFVLGGGSNILFTVNYDGLIIQNNIRGREILEESENQVILKIGAGENWHSFVLFCIQKGYGGIENLSLIPGLAGAAPIQNIGAYGVQLEEVFLNLEAFNLATGKIETFNKQQCRFGYRESIFKKKLKGSYVILNVTLRLTKKNHRFNIDYGGIKETLKKNKVKKLSIEAISDAVIQIRQSKLPDPVNLPNAGSFFKNPTVDKIDFEGLRAEFSNIPGYKAGEENVKIPAAWMIENCGWKGKRRGAIGVHDKQALVIVNYGGGTGSEIKSLANDIKTSVADTFGIELESEVNAV